MGKCISKPVAVDHPVEKPEKIVFSNVAGAGKSAAAAVDPAKASVRSLQQLFAKDEEPDEDTGQLKRIPEEDSSAEEQEEDVHKQAAAYRAAAAADNSGVLETIAEEKGLDHHPGSDNAESDSAAASEEVELHPPAADGKEEAAAKDQEKSGDKDLPGDQVRSDEPDQERPSTPEISDSKSPPAEHEEAATSAAAAAVPVPHDTSTTEQVDNAEKILLATQESDKFDLVLIKPQLSEKFEIDLSAAQATPGAESESAHQGDAASATSKVPGDEEIAGGAAAGEVDKQEEDVVVVAAPEPVPVPPGEGDKHGDLSGTGAVTENDEVAVSPSEGGDTGTLQTAEDHVDAVAAPADGGGAEDSNEGARAEDKAERAEGAEESNDRGGEEQKPEGIREGVEGTSADTEGLEADQKLSTVAEVAGAPQQGQEEFFEASEQIAEIAQNSKHGDDKVAEHKPRVEDTLGRSQDLKEGE